VENLVGGGIALMRRLSADARRERLTSRLYREVSD